MIKKLVLTVGLAVVSCLSLKAQVPTDQYLAGSITTPTGGISNLNSWVTLITTNRANVHSIQLSSTATGLVKLYDCDNTNSPFLGVNFTNNTYWTRASYQTNLVTTNISGLTGTTNIFTNQGVFTYFVTNNPATNLLNVQYAASFGANIAFINPNLNLTFARGITLETTTNVNYSIGYTP